MHIKLLAHYDKNNHDREQLLTEHLINVASKSKELGSVIKLESICQLIGLLHDFGKREDKFQRYIRGEYIGRVDHSTEGAFILGYIESKVFDNYKIEDFLKDKGLKLITWKLYGEIIKYPILAHHGLYDIIDGNFDYRTGLRLSRSNECNPPKGSLEYLNILNQENISCGNTSIYDLYLEGFKEFIEKYETIEEMSSQIYDMKNKEDKIFKNKSEYFYYGALVRLLLSILKDADIYDSSNYYRSIKDKIYIQEELNIVWNELEGLIENLYKKFNAKDNISDLDIIRTNLSNDIYDFSKIHGSGAFKMDMPVGAGKTYAGLRYAIGNASKFKKTRIFYTTAFLSILEQNANSIREVLGDKYILEHHSNIIEDHELDEEWADQKEYETIEYLKESWESPIVLTTLVQLSNTLFKHKASNIRRFSKLINSVILIDEIQSLPANAIYNFNLMNNFLTNIMNCTIVHSTATPPDLDNKKTLNYPCIYGKDGEDISIIKPIEKIDEFSRVEYHSLLGEQLDTSLNDEELLKHLKIQLEEENSVLVVLNTKNAVGKFYESLVKDTDLISSDVEILYLTTNQCPIHRLEIIKKMKERLYQLRKGQCKRRLICVSTKLVEAGVDIDFDIVYRSLAGIDSIIQCGGRCNREGKKTSKGKLFIIKYDRENLNYLPDIRKQREAAETALKIILREKTNDEIIDIEKARNYYFQKLYLNEGAAGNYLEYPIEDNETILDLLTTNPFGNANYLNKHGEKPKFKLKQRFKTAALEFELIKENTVSVITRYKNDEKIEELYTAIEYYDYYNIKRLLKILQPYTISFRKANDYENYITRELEGEVLILSREAYSSEIGLTKGELQSLIF